MTRNMAIALMLLPYAPAYSQTVAPPPPSTDLVVIAATLDAVMQPKSITDTALECVQNTACKTVLDAAAAYVGVDSSKITSAAAQIKKSKAGEESYFTYVLPTGYEYCRSKVETVSVVPATGDRASFMQVTATKNGISALTWTPKRNFGEGRSWLEAKIQVTGVRTEAAERYKQSGQCMNDALPKLIINCRGARGVNKGTKACTTFSN